MIVSRKSTQFAGLLPEASEVLHSHFQIPLFYRDYKLRHPLGIYNLSLGEVFFEFREVLDELEVFESNAPHIRQKIAEDWGDKLLSKQRQLLYAIMEHMDDCRNILKSFFPPNSGFWETEHVKLYRDKVDDY